MYLELDEVNASLAAILGPLVLGTAATGYLAASGVTGAGAAGGVLVLLDRAKDFILANAQAAAAVGAAAGVAGVATVAVALSNGGTHSPTASPPRPSVTGGLADPSTATPTPRPKKHRTRVVAPPVVLPATPVAAVLPTEAATSETPDGKPKADGTSSTPPLVLPPTKPPVSTTADIAVRLTFSLRPLGVLTPKQNGLLGNLNATATGIPAGQRATITVHVVGGTMTQKGSGCKPRGSTAVCAIGPGTPPLVFKVHGIPINATARITVPSGWTDPLLSNNQDSVLLGLISH
jgi:hypothetical protein